MSKLTKRLTAMLLSGMLIIGSASGSVFAADAQAEPDVLSEVVEVEEVTEESTDAAAEDVAAEEVTEESADAAAEEPTDVSEEAEETSTDASTEEEVVEYYTVTLYANGGYFANEWDDVLGETVESTEILNKNVSIGETVDTIPLREQENAAVTFMGWSLERDGEIVSQEFVPVENCILYAVWNVEECSNTDDGELDLSAEDVAVEDTDSQDVESADTVDQGTEFVDESTDQTEELEMGDALQEQREEESVQQEEVADEESIQEVVTPIIENSSEENEESDNGSTIFATKVSEELGDSIENVSDDAEAGVESDSGGRIASGTCGNGLKWVITYHDEYLDNRTLTISGNGSMNDYASGKAPWSSYSNSISTISFEGGIEHIGDHAFEKFVKVDTVTVPEGTITVGNSAFYQCTELIKVLLPEGLKTIGNEAFRECTYLENVNLPSSLVKIGESAFSDCYHLDSELTIQCDLGARAFLRCRKLHNVTLLQGINSISDYAFKDSNIQEIIIPEGVVSIGNWAFSGNSLERINIPDTVTYIGEYAFFKCSLGEIVIPKGVTIINEGSFKGCDKLTYLVIQEGTVSIGFDAFSGCKSLSHLIIPGSVENIGKSAFSSCTGVKTISFLGSKPQIGSSAFYRVVADGYHPANDDSWENVTSSFYSGTINWGIISFTAELPDNQKEWCFTGNNICPLPLVKNAKGEELKKDVDYTLTYLNNIDPGTATITATGLGDYAGQTASVTFEIKAPITAVLSENLFYFDSSSDYQVFKPSPIVTYNDKYLVEKTDYTLEYKNNTSPGKATVIIKGIGNYAGTVELPFYLVSASGLEEAFEYTGEEIVPVFSLTADKKLTAGTDYVISYKDNITPGPECPQIIVTGIGQYTGELHIPFIIKPKKVTQVTSKTGTQREINVKFEDHPCSDGYIVKWDFQDKNGKDAVPQERTIIFNSMSVEDGGENESFEYNVDDDLNGWCEYHGDSMPRANRAIIQVCAYKDVQMPDGTINRVMGDYSDELNVPTGNQVIRKEMWGFTNAKVNDRDIYKYTNCSSAYASILSHTSEGGMCFGMSMAGAYSVIYDDSFGLESLGRITSTNNAKQYISNSTGLNAKQLIYYCQMAQDFLIGDLIRSSFVINGDDEPERLDLQGLYTRIKACQEGEGNPVVLDMCMQGNDHAIMAMGISEEDDRKVVIEIYNPNDGNNGSSNLILYKSNGTLNCDEASYYFEFSDDRSYTGLSGVDYIKNSNYQELLLFITVDNNTINRMNELAKEIISDEDKFLIQVETENSFPFNILAKQNSNIEILQNINPANGQLIFDIKARDTADGSILINNAQKATIRFGNAQIEHEITLTIEKPCDIQIIIDDPFNPRILIIPVDSSHYDLVSNFFSDNRVDSTVINLDTVMGSIASFEIYKDKVTINGVDRLSIESDVGTIDGAGNITESPVSSTPEITLDNEGTYVYSLYKNTSILNRIFTEESGTSELIFHNHVWDDGIVITDSTLDETGTKMQTCELCQETKTVEIPKKISINDATVTGISSVAYTGKAITQTPTITLNSIILEEGTDYTIEYSNNTNAGTASIMITGIGSYGGTKNEIFIIDPASLTTATVTGISTKTYTGKALSQTPVVKLGTTTLKKNTDYKLTYKNNTNAGTATVTITGIGNYEGTVTKTFTIKPASLTTATVTGISDETYTGKALTQNPVVKLGTTTLKKDTDYTVSYSNNTNAGTATVTITGIGNYEGTVTKTFTIKPASITTATVTGIKTKTYTGNALTQTPAVTLGSTTLKSGTDYTVTYKNNVNAGTATVVITGKGNYIGTKTVKFTINKAAQSITVKTNASPVTVGKVSTVTITGAKGKKSFKSSNTKLATVTSAGKVSTKKVGSVTITATSAATTNYKAASKSITIIIRPKPTSISKLSPSKGAITVKWKKQASQTSGYQIQYSSRSDFATNIIVTISKTGTTSKKVTGLKRKNKYYVRIRTYKTVSGTKYYSAWSTVKTVKTK